MLWCSLREVAQGGLQGSAGLFRGRTVYHLRNRTQRAEEHLDAPVAVREQAGGVGKIVGLRSNLDRHSLRLHPSTQRLAKLGSVSFFHHDRARKQNIVFEMNVLVQVSFKVSQRFVQSLEADAGI